MLENIISTTIPYICIIRNIIYYIAGAMLFLAIMSSILPIERAEDKKYVIWVIAIIIVWSWIFSKLITL